MTGRQEHKSTFWQCQGCKKTNDEVLECRIRKINYADRVPRQDCPREIELAKKAEPEWKKFLPKSFMIATVPLDQVHEAPYIPPRFFVDPSELSNLCESLRSDAQVDRVKLNKCRCPVGKGYDIIDGHQRINAERQIGGKNIDAEIYNIDEKAALRISIISDEFHIKQTFLDRADKIEFAINFMGFSKEEVGRLYQKGDEWIDKHLQFKRLKKASFLKINEILKETSPLGKGSFLENTGVSHFLPLISIENEQKQAELVERIINEGWTVEKVRTEANVILGREKPKPPPSGFITVPLKDGSKRMLAKDEIEGVKQTDVGYLLQHTRGVQKITGQTFKNLREIGIPEIPVPETPTPVELGKIDQSEGLSREFEFTSPPIPELPTELPKKPEPEPETLSSDVDFPCPKCHQTIFIECKQFPDGRTEHRIKEG